MSTAPNLEHARLFLHRFDPEAEFFTFQTFDDSERKRRELAKIVHTDPVNGALETLAKLNAKHRAGIFFAVNATDGKGRQTHNVVRVRAVFVDLDGAPLAPVLTCGLDPHIVCESSPGKYHAYWKCDDCSLDRFERVQRALARRFGGDPSVHDLPRVLRVPGFLHRKGEPFESRLLEGVGFNGPPYPLAEIVGTLALDLAHAESERKQSGPGADGKIAPGNRHAHLFALGRSMARRTTREAVRAALAAENQARCDPPLPDGEIDYLAARAFEAKHAQGWQDQAQRDADCDDWATHHAREENATAGDSAPVVLNLAAMLLYQFPTREPILDPWLLTQSLSLVHAWRGTGKTHFALGIAYAIATGGKFLKWNAPRPRRVLYLDGEMPGSAMQERLRALVESDDRDFDPDYLQIVTPDAQTGAMPDLATVEGQEAINRIVEAHGSEVIIVDNISTLCRDTGPENEAESWRAPQGWALQQRRAGRSVVFVHHSGKTGKQRGSSKREDTLDVCISLRWPADYSPDQGARFEIHFEKYRPSGGDDAKPIEAKLETNAEGKPIWTWRTVEESTFERVIALHEDGLKPSEIADELEINKSTVSRHLSRARREGRISKDKT